MTDFEKTSYEAIIAKGEAALARLSASNPMRKIVAENVEFARARLAGVR